MGERVTIKAAAARLRGQCRYHPAADPGGAARRPPPARAVRRYTVTYGSPASFNASRTFLR